jgi:leader peptidase (prepilin peptidase)/N-methyltransferase
MSVVGMALAALAGAAIGVLTHALDQRLGREDEDATGAPLFQERLWAPLLDAIVFAVLAQRYGLGADGLVRMALGAVLVQVLVFDARHRLILNRVMYPAMAVALAGAAVSPLLTGPPGTRIQYAVLGALMGGGLFLVASLVSGGGIGLGDAKLMFFAGAVLGSHPLFYAPILRAAFLGVFLGGVGALAFLVSRRRGMRDFIPYGPFLVAGVLLVVIYPCGLFGPTTCT